MAKGWQSAGKTMANVVLTVFIQQEERSIETTIQETKQTMEG